MDSYREDLILEIYSAPKRRLDNEIHRLHMSIDLLKMHCKLMEHNRRVYNSTKLRLRLINLGISVASASYGISNLSLRSAFHHSTSHASKFVFAVVQALGQAVWNNRSLTLSWAAGVALIGYTVSAWQTRILSTLAQSLTSIPNLQLVFEQIYRKEISTGDDHYLSVWNRLVASIENGHGVRSGEVAAMPPVRADDWKLMDQILERDLTVLRRIAAAEHSQG